MSYSSQEKTTTMVPTPPLVAKEKSSKTNVIKLSPQQLREAESLGYVELRGTSKVLTKAGLKEYLPKINPNFKLKRKDSDASVGSLEATSSSEGRIERIKSIDSSVICLDVDDSPKKIQSPLIVSQKTKPIYKTINNEPILIPDEDSEAKSDGLSIQKSETPPVVKAPQVIKKTEEKVLTPTHASPVKSIQSSEAVGKNESPIASVTATTSTPTKENNNLGDQSSQILAVPAENFGGPANAFYLCSVGDDGSFTPMNNEALYLDASNQLVPLLPETQERSEADQEDSTTEDAPDATSEVGSQSIILNTADGQQIILDQQSLLAMAVSGDVSQLFTQDGQQLIYPGSAQEILNAIAASQNELGEQSILMSDQDILATALANTEVYQQDQLLTGSLTDLNLNPPVKAHVSETNTVLTQSPIMSTTEQPTKNNGNAEKVTSEISKNLDEKLAEIGVTPHQLNVPVSLELPITVTNPAIAPKTTTNPLEINSMYPATALGVTVSSTLSTPEVSPLLAGIIAPTTSKTPDYQPHEPDNAPAIPSILNSEISEDFIPDTPEAAINHQSTQEEDTNSSEIPLQPNIDAELNSNGTDPKNNGTADHGLSMSEETSNGVNSTSINNNSEEKQEFTSTTSMDISDIPLPDETMSQPHQSSGGTLETLNEQMEIDES